MQRKSTGESRRWTPVLVPVFILETVQDAVKRCTVQEEPARRWDVCSTTLVSPAASVVKSSVDNHFTQCQEGYTVKMTFCTQEFIQPQKCVSAVGIQSRTWSLFGICVHLKVVQAHGKSYHTSCFRCVICRQSLEGLPFNVDTDSRIYCVSDYHKVQAPRCAACQMPILPSEGCTESIRVVSFGRNYHAECYGSDVNLV